MIEAVAPTERIRRAYNLFSYFYGAVITPLERRPRMEALKRAGVQPKDKVLEVAVGPGATLLEIVKRVEKGNVVCGVDLSPKMLEKSHRLLSATGYSNIDLREADARQLPFSDSTFDVLFNSYMLDLIPLHDLPVVLDQFKRVLKPGGRLVLVNMSKKEECGRTWWERIYMMLPKPLVPYLLGGCRPVMMESMVKDAGFHDVRREFIHNIIPSEVVTARRP